MVTLYIHILFSMKVTLLSHKKKYTWALWEGGMKGWEAQEGSDGDSATVVIHVEVVLGGNDSSGSWIHKYTAGNSV